MENVDAPENFVKELKDARVMIIGPPPGISREHCVDAQVVVTKDWMSDGMGLGFTAFFKPTEEELKDIYYNGALLRVQLRGNGLVPHSLSVW